MKVGKAIPLLPESPIWVISCGLSDFATRYARAREAQADLMDDMILDVANGATSETAAADRVKISAKAISKAVRALDGELSVNWKD